MSRVLGFWLLGLGIRVELGFRVSGCEGLGCRGVRVLGSGVQGAWVLGSTILLSKHPHPKPQGQKLFEPSKPQSRRPFPAPQRIDLETQGLSLKLCTKP